MLIYLSVDFINLINLSRVFRHICCHLWEISPLFFMKVSACDHQRTCLKLSDVYSHSQKVLKCFLHLSSVVSPQQTDTRPS